jgi:tetratricopeptide (TPR) repeat protein
MRTIGKSTPVFILAVTTLALSLSGCNQTADMVMNRSGMSYYNSGQYAYASSQFRQALNVDPNNADFAGNLAMALQKSGDPVGAEKMYQRALVANPTHEPTYRQYSRLLVSQHRSGEAMALMQQYVGTNGYHVEPHIELAQLHRELGNRTGEAHALKQALQVSPHHPTALAGMGRYFQDMGQSTTAMKMYEQSLQANYAQPEVQARYASLRGQIQQEQQATATLARLQDQHQRTAMAIQSYQQQNQTRLASAQRRQTATRIVQVPQPAYGQAPMNSSQRMAYRPAVSSVPMQQYATQPDFNYSPTSAPYAGSVAITQDSGGFYSEAGPPSIGEYEAGETIAFPTEVSAALPDDQSTATRLNATTGPSIGAPPTRVSKALPTILAPQTVVPSRILNRHDRVNPSQAPTSAPPALPSPAPTSTGSNSEGPVFDDGDIFSNADVWDPIGANDDPAHTPDAAASGEIEAF